MKMNVIEKNIPVAIFLWKRPENTKIILEKIRAYSPEVLLVIVDGPGKAEDIQPNIDVISEVRKFKESADFSVKMKISDHNLGLKESFLSGFNFIFDNAEEVIIMEDDTIPDPSFFYFCEYYLNVFRKNENVVAINGSFRVNEKVKSKIRINSDFLNRVFCPWGWATWKKKFLSIYNPEIGHLTIVEKLRAVYYLNSLELFQKRYRVLKRIINGNLITWDVQFQWNIILNDKRIVTCHHNLITNNGLDESASTQKENYFGLLNRPVTGKFSCPEVMNYITYETNLFYDKEVYHSRGTSSFLFHLLILWVVRRSKRVYYALRSVSLRSTTFIRNKRAVRKILEPAVSLFLSMKLLVQRKPLINLFLLGEQRCGTTSFYKWIEKSSDFAVGRKKELQLFNNSENFDTNDNLKPGINLKELYIKGTLSKIFTGKYFADVTPDYVFNPESLDRIKLYNPDARLVYLIRNPVNRFVSSYGFYFHTVKYLSPFFKFNPDGRRMKDFFITHPNFTFADYFELETSSQPVFKSLIRGLYAKNIQTILSYFPANQLYIGLFENLVNPLFYQNESERIADFLKVKPFKFTFPHFHSSGKTTSVANEKQIILLRDYYIDDMLKLKKYYLPGLDWVI